MWAIPQELIKVAVHLVHLLLVLQVGVHHEAAGLLERPQPLGCVLATDHRLEGSVHKIRL